MERILKCIFTVCLALNFAYAQDVGGDGDGDGGDGEGTFRERTDQNRQNRAARFVPSGVQKFSQTYPKTHF